MCEGLYSDETTRNDMPLQPTHIPISLNDQAQHRPVLPRSPAGESQCNVQQPGACDAKGRLRNSQMQRPDKVEQDAPHQK